MRSFIIVIIAFFLCNTGSIAQSKLGDVAAVTIHTPNLDSSIAIYKKLGFAKVALNDVPSTSTHITDGSLLITLLKDTSRYIGLTYYVADVDKLAASLETDNIVFDKKPGIGDTIKNYSIKSPDGFNIVLTQNATNIQQPKASNLLTIKKADINAVDRYPNKILGIFGEFAHPVVNLKSSISFWEKLGFTVKDNQNFPYPHAILSDSIMLIGLHKTRNFNNPVITYFGAETEDRVKLMKKKGLKTFTEIAGPKNVSFKTWEGQNFYIFSLGM